MSSPSIDVGDFQFTKGTFSNSPTFYTPATDRDKAIARLQMMAGDPSIPAECEEQAEARKYLKQVIREDPELRQRLKFWKQYIDAPNGRERMYKEIVLPKCQLIYCIYCIMIYAMDRNFAIYLFL